MLGQSEAGDARAGIECTNALISRVQLSPTISVAKAININPWNVVHTLPVHLLQKSFWGGHLQQRHFYTCPPKINPLPASSQTISS